MPVTITIRSVPDKVRDVLAARAKRQGKSLQEYLSGELGRLAEKPTVEEWFDEIRAMKAKYPPGELADDAIVNLIHEARDERDAQIMEHLEGERRE